MARGAPVVVVEGRGAAGNWRPSLGGAPVSSFFVLAQPRLGQDEAGLWLASRSANGSRANSARKEALGWVLIGNVHLVKRHGVHNFLALLQLTLDGK